MRCRLPIIAAVLASGCSCRSEQANRTAVKPTFVPGAPGDIEVTKYGVVVDDPGKATANREALQRAIDDNAGKHLVLRLPVGKIYLDRGSHFDSLRFTGISDITLAGHGAGSQLVIAGDAAGGYWVGIEVFDGARGITLRDFAIEHGDIDHPSPTQQDHLIQLNAQTAMVSDVEIANVMFGPCIGDALRIAGTSPNFVSHTKVHDFIMATHGQPQAPRQGSRSGIGLQRGFKDLEIYDFYITGAKNSPIDMEPTASAPMDGLDIHDGIIDNSAGSTAFAVSLTGWEDPGHVVTPLRASKFHRVMILDGQITILDTDGLEISDVSIIVSGARGPMVAAKEPLIYVFHDNKNLKLVNVDMVRGAGAGSGGLLLVTHGNETYPDNIEISGGRWVSQVDPQVKGSAYLAFESVHHLAIRDLMLKLDGPTPSNQYAIRFRSSARDVREIDLHRLSISSSHGKLAGAVWLAATNAHAIADVHVTGFRASGAVTHGVVFDATDDSTIEAAPVLDDNDFRGATAEWTALHAAASRVTPTTAKLRP